MMDSSPHLQRWQLQQWGIIFKAYFNFVEVPVTRLVTVCILEHVATLVFANLQLKVTFNLAFEETESHRL